MDRSEDAERLWSLLDDIDTLSDMLKEPMGEFQRRALIICEKRHAILRSDGYVLSRPPEEARDAG